MISKFLTYVTVPRKWATCLFFSMLLFAVSATAGSVKIGFVEPSTATAGATSFCMLNGNGLGDKAATVVRLVPASTADPSFKGLMSGTTTPAGYQNKITLLGAAKGGRQRGVQFELPANAPTGQYFLILEDTNGLELGSVIIYVGGATPSSASPTPSTPLTTSSGPYTPCHNGNTSSTAGPSGNSQEEVSCSYSLLSYSETKDNYGQRVAKTYYALQVGVTDNDPQFDYLLRSIVLTLPDGRRVASRVKRFAQGVAVEGRIHDTRNVIYNSLNWAGSIAGGLTIFSFASTVAKNATNLFQGAFLSGFSTTFPDVSVDNVNRFNNAVFDDSQATVVPKSGVAQPSVFVIALVPRPQGKGLDQNYIDRFGEQIRVAVNGTRIQSVNLITFSTDTFKFTSPQALGTTSNTQSFTITNSNQNPVSLTFQQAPHFAANMRQTSTTATSGAVCGGNVIPAATSCTVDVTFSPKDQEGSVSEKLQIGGNFTNSPYSITMVGIGTPVSTSSSSIDFGTQSVASSSPSQSVTLKNLRSKGGQALANLKISITGDNSGDFTRKAPVAGDCPDPLATLDAATSCLIQIVFKPGSGGGRTASLSISDQAGNPLASVALSGTGGKVAVTPPTPTIVPQPGQQSATVTFNVPASSGAPVPSGTVEYAVDNGSTQQVSLNAAVAVVTLSSLSAGTHILTAKYDGDNNYQPFTFQAATFNITIPVVPVTQLKVSGIPATVPKNAPQTLTVTAQDANGNLVSTFAGTVRITNSDTRAAEVNDYPFVPASDSGKHDFSITFATPGLQTITVGVLGTTVKASLQTTVGP